MALEELFKGRGRGVEPTPRESIYYIYRFPGTGSYHLSTSGYGRGYHEVEDAVRRRGIGGVHVIRPHWRTTTRPQLRI